MDTAPLPPLTWSSRVMRVAELKPYEKNPRRISKEAFARLKKSLQQDGYHQRLLVAPDGTLIGGHQRIRALTEMGVSEVEVLVPSRDLTPAEFDRINIRDNLEFGEFDMEALANNFDVEELREIGLDEKLLKDLLEEDEAPAEEGGEEVTDSVARAVVVACNTEDEQLETLQKLRGQGLHVYLAKGSVKIA